MVSMTLWWVHSLDLRKLCFGLLLHTCSRMSMKKISLSCTARKICRGRCNLSGRISPVCVSTNFCMLQSHCQASSPSHVCNWVTFKWSQPPRSNFLQQILSLFFYQKIWENFGYVCFLGAIFFGKSWQIFNITKLQRKPWYSQCLFFFLLFYNFWCCSSNI